MKITLIVQADRPDLVRIVESTVAGAARLVSALQTGARDDIRVLAAYGHDTPTVLQRAETFHHGYEWHHRDVLQELERELGPGLDAIAATLTRRHADRRGGGGGSGLDLEELGLGPARPPRSRKGPFPAKDPELAELLGEEPSPPPPDVGMFALAFEGTYGVRPTVEEPTETSIMDELVGGDR